MVFAQTNIFKLPQPQYYDCYVDRYHGNFHALRIRADRFREYSLDGFNSFEVVFSAALYWEGAFNWTGANFCIAEEADCLSTLRQAGILTPQSDPVDVEETLDAYRLFVIEMTNGHRAKLIAHFKDYTMTTIS